MDQSIWFQAVRTNNIEFVEEYCERYKCSRTEDGDTGLILATRSNYIGIVGILAEAEAGLAGRDGRTALLIAAEYGLSEICQILAPREHTIINSEGRNAIMIALGRENLAVVRALAPFFGRETDKDGRTALSYAVSAGNAEATSRLLDTLKYTAEDVEAEISAADSKGHAEVIVILQQYLSNNVKVSLKSRPSSGRTPGQRGSVSEIRTQQSPSGLPLSSELQDSLNQPEFDKLDAPKPEDEYLDFVSPSEEGYAALSKSETFQPHKASARLDSWLDSTMKSLGTFADEHKKIIADYKSLNTRHNDLLAILRDMKSAIGYQSNEVGRDLIDFVYKMQNSLVQLQNQIRDMTKLARTQEAELAQLQSTKLKLEGTNTANVEVESLLKKTLDAREADYKALQERFRECQSRLLKAEDKAKEVTQENTTLQTTISELKAEKDSIKTILNETDAEKRRLQEKIALDEKELMQLRQNVRKLDAAGTLSPTRKPMTASANNAEQSPVVNDPDVQSASTPPAIPTTPSRVDPKHGTGEKVSERTAEELEKIQSKMMELKEYEARLRADKIKMREEAVQIRREIETAQDEAIRYKSEAKELRERVSIMSKTLNRGSLSDEAKPQAEQQLARLKSLEDENDSLRTELAYFRAVKTSATTGDLATELSNTRAAMQAMQEQLTSLKAEKALSDKYIQELLTRGSTGSLIGTGSIGAVNSRPGSGKSASNSALKHYLHRELEQEPRPVLFDRAPSKRSTVSSLSSSSGGIAPGAGPSLVSDYKAGKSLKLSILKSHMDMNTVLGEKNSALADASAAITRNRASSSGMQYGGLGF